MGILISVLLQFPLLNNFPSNFNFQLHNNFRPTSISLSVLSQFYLLIKVKFYRALGLDLSFLMTTIQNCNRQTEKQTHKQTLNFSSPLAACHASAPLVFYFSRGGLYLLHISHFSIWL